MNLRCSLFPNNRKSLSYDNKSSPSADTKEYADQNLKKKLTRNEPHHGGKAGRLLSELRKPKMQQ